jgi:hypothetical protein
VPFDGNSASVFERYLAKSTDIAVHQLCAAVDAVPIRR